MPEPKPSRRRAAKRDVILDAAQVVFLDVGYAAASVDGVAAAAGVSKATIYAHFESKDRLFAAVIRRRCETSAAFQPVNPDGPARAVLTEVGLRLMTLLLSPDALALYRVVVAESVRQPDLARAFYESGPGTGKAQIGEVIAALHRRGEMTVADPQKAADQFVGMLRTDLFMRALLGLEPAPGQSLERLVAEAVDTLLGAHGGRPEG